MGIIGMSAGVYIAADLIWPVLSRPFQLIPVALLVVVVALFFGTVNHQQFDDLGSPGVLPLMERCTCNRSQTRNTVYVDRERNRSTRG